MCCKSKVLQFAYNTPTFFIGRNVFSMEISLIQSKFKLCFFGKNSLYVGNITAFHNYICAIKLNVGLFQYLVYCLSKYPFFRNNMDNKTYFIINTINLQYCIVSVVQKSNLGGI